MDETLNVQLIANRQTGVDGGWSAAPVLVELEATGSSDDLLTETFGRAVVTFACNTYIQRKLVTRPKHLTHVGLPRGTSGSTRSGTFQSANGQPRGSKR